MFTGTPIPFFVSLSNCEAPLFVFNLSFICVLSLFSGIPFFCQTATIEMFCSILLISAVVFHNLKIFLLSSLAPFVVFQPVILFMFLSITLEKVLGKRGVICSEEKSFKELNILSTPLGSQSVISNIIQITLRKKLKLILFINCVSKTN